MSLQCYSVFISFTGNLLTKLTKCLRLPNSNFFNLTGTRYFIFLTRTMIASILDLSPDLLTLLCAHCLPGALINLAATCRMLSEHASSQIWSTIPSFGTIAYTLSRELWVQELVKESDGIAYVTLVSLRATRLTLNDIAWQTHNLPSRAHIQIFGICKSCSGRVHGVSSY